MGPWFNAKCQPKLRDQHVNLTPQSRMRVNLAAQVGFYPLVDLVMSLIIYKWNLHGGKTTMLYLNLSGHNIFKKEVWHLTGKTLPNSNALPPFFKETCKINIK